MPAAETVPEASLIVMVPAAPPLPMTAVSPFTQAVSATAFDQFRSVVVFQFPLPSLGAAGLAGLASQVRVAAVAGSVQAAAASAKICPTRAGRRQCRRIAVLLSMSHSPAFAER